ncbi:hypothetical protein BHE74_00004526 [Ensete ventricosum]|nr:hypothetical protein BHE74_00004526 [Ensete ventricosum]RZR83757.1 hypothetical protein BHM03_00010453 [Ensete ventricosum]
MLEAYDGSSDPTEHVATFHAQMTLYGTSNGIMCLPASYGRLWSDLPRLYQKCCKGPTSTSPSRFWWWRNVKIISAPGLSPLRAHPLGSQGGGRREVCRPFLGRSISLNFTRTDIFLQIRENGLLKTPNPMRSRAEDWDRKRYCRFHCDYGHDTEECYDLKNQIEDLICRGHLDRYIMKPQKPSLRPKGPVERQVDFIVGGPIAGGVSSSARKAYARVKVQKRPQPQSDPGITFDSESEYLDHDDALVVTTHIANAHVKRIMIDTGSAIDILYLDVFHKLGMTNRDLILITLTLTGFTSDAITPVGVATLPVTFDDEPRTKTLMVPSMVVDLPSAYNVIIGWPTLNKLRAIVSTYHRNMKFPTSAG